MINKFNKLKVWFIETRPAFLLLTPTVVLLGVSVALYDGASINTLNLLLALLAAIFAHISVNVLNDYFDYIKGIDLRVKRTPFSGGSGILPAGLLKPRSVYLFGFSCLLMAALIGLYFYQIFGLPIILFVLAGIILVYFYTTYLTRIGLAEFSAGLGFALIPLGVYYTQVGRLSGTILASSLVTGIVVANLLLLNEFPDTYVDKEAGRRHIPAMFGLRTGAKVYSALTISIYLCVIVFTFVDYLTLSSLVVLLTLPLATRTIRGVLKNYDHIGALIPFMARNVMLTFGVILTLSMGFLINILL